MDEYENENEPKKKEIEVIQGDGDDLNISPVYDHIDIEKPDKEKEKREIIIPEEKSTDKQED